MAYQIPAEATALPVFACLGILVLIVPFTWHYKNRNAGPCSLILFIAVGNLFTLINVIIWPTDDYENWWLGYVLCDIEVKLQYPCMTGIGCATLCITRSLAMAINVDRADVLETRSSRRKKAFIDLAICFALPFLQMLLHYIIQPNRYYIEPIDGCTASYDRSWPTVVIMFMWPLILCLINCYYIFAIFHRLRKLRSSSHGCLDSTLSRRSNLTSAQYFRLSIMATTLLLVYTPVSIYFFYVNMNIAWLSYDWDAIHYPYEVWLLPVFLPASGGRGFDRWIGIMMSLFIFLYFGLAVDAKEIYRLWLLNLGFGRLFPGLKVRSAKGCGWLNKLSLTRHVRLYYESIATKTSTASTAHSDSDYILSHISSRKESSVTSEQHIPTKSTSPSTTNPFIAHPLTNLTNSINAPTVPTWSSFSTTTADAKAAVSHSQNNIGVALTPVPASHSNSRYAPARSPVLSSKSNTSILSTRSKPIYKADAAAANGMRLDDTDL